MCGGDLVPIPLWRSPPVGCLMQPIVRIQTKCIGTIPLAFHFKSLPCLCMDEFRSHRYHNFTLCHIEKNLRLRPRTDCRASAPKFSHVLIDSGPIKLPQRCTPTSPALMEIEFRKIKPWKCCLLQFSTSAPPADPDLALPDGMTSATGRK
jgi:hypothetical protein